MLNAYIELMEHISIHYIYLKGYRMSKYTQTYDNTLIQIDRFNKENMCTYKFKGNSLFGLYIDMENISTWAVLTMQDFGFKCKKDWLPNGNEIVRISYDD